jgi:hypothetical protein
MRWNLSLPSSLSIKTWSKTWHSSRLQHENNAEGNLYKDGRYTTHRRIRTMSAGEAVDFRGTPPARRCMRACTITRMMVRVTQRVGDTMPHLDGSSHIHITNAHGISASLRTAKAESLCRLCMNTMHQTVHVSTHPQRVHHDKPRQTSKEEQGH